MEKNNGSEQVSVQELLSKADPQVQQLCQALFNRVQVLENNWMKDRVNYLFKVIDCKAFSDETKDKAREELENFLFPKVETPKAEE